MGGNGGIRRSVSLLGRIDAQAAFLALCEEARKDRIKGDRTERDAEQNSHA